MSPRNRKGGMHNLVGSAAEPRLEEVVDSRRVGGRPERWAPSSSGAFARSCCWRPWHWLDVTAWVYDTIDRVGIDPDYLPGLFELSEVAVLVPIDSVGNHAKGDTPTTR
jgi:hypothetical protein